MSELRIGELSRRTGVPAELLRAWERRYGVLKPRRSAGGFRLYSEDDVERIRAMRRELANGISPAEAAAAALTAPVPEPAPQQAAVDARELERALDELDDARAHQAFDRLLGALSVDALLAQIVLPYLRRLGDRWADGRVSVGQEHFASNLLRGRLLGLARGWDGGLGPRAVLACPGGELHDLPLIVFGLALRARGWRITFLGADTPLDTVAAVVPTVEPALVVLSATEAERFDGAGALAEVAPLALAGPGATPALAAAVGARLLGGDPLSEAARLAGEAAGASPARRAPTPPPDAPRARR